MITISKNKTNNTQMVNEDQEFCLLEFGPYHLAVGAARSLIVLYTVLS